MRIKILWLGKTKNPSIRMLASDYLERIRRFVSCEVMEARDLAGAKNLREADRMNAEASELMRHVTGAPLIVALDVCGKELTSDDFAGWFRAEQNRGTKEAVFVIGGADGLSETITRKAGLRLSLGRMTWTHEMCRVLLLEQIYRAFSILNNIPYHK